MLAHSNVSLAQPTLCATWLRSEGRGVRKLTFRNNTLYIRGYILIANLVCMLLLPFCLLAILNYKLYAVIRVTNKQSKQDILSSFQETGRRNQKTVARHQRERQVASLLLLLVSVFGCCNGARVVTNIYEVFMLPATTPTPPHTAPTAPAPTLPPTN